MDEGYEKVAEISYTGPDTEKAWCENRLAMSRDGDILAIRYNDTLRMVAIQRELSFPGWAEWDEKAEPYLEHFLDVYPHPNEEQIRLFLRELGAYSLGWIRPEGVRAKIIEGMEARKIREEEEARRIREEEARRIREEEARKLREEETTMILEKGQSFLDDRSKEKKRGLFARLFVRFGKQKNEG